MLCDRERDKCLKMMKMAFCMQYFLSHLAWDVQIKILFPFSDIWAVISHILHFILFIKSIIKGEKIILKYNFDFLFALDPVGWSDSKGRSFTRRSEDFRSKQSVITGGHT